MDHSRQPRHLLLVEDRLRPLCRSPKRQRTTGRRWATSSSSLTSLAEDVMKAAKVTGWRELRKVHAAELDGMICDHPLAPMGYDFDVPLLDGDHVTDDAGTGFVHTAPGHGADDYNIWIASKAEAGIDASPSPSMPMAIFTKDAPGFDRQARHHRQGREGRCQRGGHPCTDGCRHASSRGRLKHQYPHSWRSKKPIIFRNTPQWFISMVEAKGLRDMALKAIDDTEVLPGRRPEPPARHDRAAARLGDLAPARLGRAHRRLRQQGDRRNPQRFQGERAHRRGLH